MGYKKLAKVIESLLIRFAPIMVQHKSKSEVRTVPSYITNEQECLGGRSGNQQGFW